MRAQSRQEINWSNWKDFAAPAVASSAWTAIVPAAGRGSRLGSDRPKILYPVANRLLLEWLLDFLEPYCSRLVFVLSPGGMATVRTELERLIRDGTRLRYRMCPVEWVTRLSWLSHRSGLPTLSLSGAIRQRSGESPLNLACVCTKDQCIRP